MLIDTDKKPVIGVTPCDRIDDYLESVKLAGGRPIVLRNDQDPQAVLHEVDGVLLTGGLDVDPSLYKQAKHPTTEIAPDRDKFEIPLSQEAVKRNIPVLAICRGVQVLNVAEGGTLTQDIPTELETPLNHAVNQPKTDHTHAIAVTPGSTLANALGAGTSPGTCTVNSRHHQALDHVAPGFIVSATSPDGIVEAIEKPDASFVVGVQWHPENFWRTGEFKGLFDAFVAAADARASTTKAR
jgi:putative glutamine amidotransferase